MPTTQPLPQKPHSSKEDQARLDPGARPGAIVVAGTPEPRPCRDAWVEFDRASVEPGPEQTPPLLSASLEPLETNPWDSPIWSRSEVRFHQRDWKSRRTIIKALFSDETADLAKRAERIWGCCSMPQILMDPHGLPVLQPGWCRDRLCPACSNRRAHRSRDQLLKVTAGMNSVRFLTLTLKSNDDSLKCCVDRLDKAFKVLRASAIWKRHVSGGLAVLEVTRHHRTGHWHPHLHVLVDGEFFPHAMLKKAWLEATGDSFIVDIRVVHDRRSAAGYIAKYITKGTALASWGTDEIIEFARALHGRRLIRTFGNCHGIKIDPKPEPLTPDGFRRLCTVSLLAAAARALMPEALAAIDTLKRVSRLWRTVFPDNSPVDEPRPPPTAGDLESVCEFCQELQRLADEQHEAARRTFVLSSLS
ncbi:hypothetical protein LCGC14_1875750 [marine sediment metagenome]|uniref:Replication protein n=1 Tax=marine sediment metagenome TaxID=412755 RepID=A0A0F9G3W7_9ZZZZ